MAPAGAKHICTMVDEAYLCFCLALHDSVRRRSPDWTLHAVCLDERAASVLGELSLDGLEVVPFEELERIEPALAIAREVRPRHDFVMTSKPFALRRVLGDEGRAAVTWLDADALFFSSPDSILEELGEESVLLAPQGVPPAFRWVEERTGALMGGLATFRNDPRGLEALGWWADRCLFGGCPRSPDRHRFGDQKYLQELPSRFAGVRVTPNTALWLAPSNVEGHAVSAGPSGPLVDGAPLVLYQYTGFRMRRDGGYTASFPPWRIGPRERELLYEPYIAAVSRARELVRGVAPDFDGGFAPADTLGDRAMAFGSRAKGALLRTRQRLLARSAS